MHGIAKEGHDGEGPQIHEQVHRRVKGHRGNGLSGRLRIGSGQHHGRRDGHDHVTGLGDRGVSQQPLDVGLTISRQIAERAGDDRHKSQHASQKVAGRSQGFDLRCSTLGGQYRFGNVSLGLLGSFHGLLDVGRRLGHGEHRDFMAGNHGRRNGAKPNCHPNQQRQGRRFGGHRQERVHFGAGPLEDIGTPEMEGHGGELEGDAHQDHQSAQRQHHVRAVLQVPCLKQRGKPDGHGRQMHRAQHAGQQADAVEHDAGRARAVHGIFERRLAALTAALEDAGQGIGRHAGHFHAQEDHQQVIGRSHQAHAERRAQHERVHVRRGVAVGNPRDAGENRK